MRVFTSEDRESSTPVLVINEALAQSYFRGQDPIGQRVWFGGGSSYDSPDSSAIAKLSVKVVVSAVTSAAPTCRADIAV